jgi:hypothetical protein
MNASIEEQVREIVIENLNDPSKRLHGFYEIGQTHNRWVTESDAVNSDAKEEGGLILFPYEQMLDEFAAKYDGTQMCDDWFKRGHLGIVNSKKLLARSIQRLGESEQHLVACYPVPPFDLNTRRDDYNARSDLTLDYNSILMQLRILTDCVGFTLFPIVNGTEPHIGRHGGFRDVLSKVEKSASKQAEKPASRRLDCRRIRRFLADNGFGTDAPESLKHKDGWFYRLAGFGETKPPGLKDAVMHHAAFQMHAGPRKDAEGNYMPNSVDGILAGIKGAYTKQSLFDDITQIIDGFFLFLDAATREVWERESLQIPEWKLAPRGIIRILGDSSFIRQWVPLISTPLT